MASSVLAAASVDVGDDGVADGNHEMVAEGVAPPPAPDSVADGNHEMVAGVAPPPAPDSVADGNHEMVVEGVAPPPPLAPDSVVGSTPIAPGSEQVAPASVDVVDRTIPVPDVARVVERCLRVRLGGGNR